MSKVQRSRSEKGGSIRSDGSPSSSISFYFTITFMYHSEQKHQITTAATSIVVE